MPRATRDEIGWGKTAAILGGTVNRVQLTEMSPCTPFAENGQRLQIVGRHGGMPVRSGFGRSAAQPRATRTLPAGARRAPPVRVRRRQRGVLKAREIDPAFVMAYWGEAMTYHQTLWRNENVDAARQALARLAPTPSLRRARSNRPPKEQGWLGAVERLFGEGDADARRAAVRGRDGASSTRESPDDPGRRLVLRARAARHDVAQPDRLHRRARRAQRARSPAARPRRRWRRFSSACCARIPSTLARCTTCCTTRTIPAHAQRALAAARTLARLAPESSHTRHMPAHIFLQLGLWQDAARSDPRRSRRPRPGSRASASTPAMRNYHALSWLPVRAAAAGPLPRCAGRQSTSSRRSSRRAAS